MARQPKERGPAWPAWFYSPVDDGKGVFHSEEDVPAGWTRKKGVPEPEIEVTPTVILDRDVLVAELTELDIPIKPTWGVAHMKRIIDGDVSSAW